MLILLDGGELGFLRALGDWRVRATRVDHVQLELHVMINVLEERVIEFEAHEGRIREGLDDEAPEREAPQRAVDPSEDHQGDHVRQDAGRERDVAESEDQGPRPAMGHRRERDGLVPVSRYDNLDVCRQAECYAREEHKALFDQLGLALIRGCAPVAEHELRIDRGQHNHLRYQADNEATPQEDSLLAEAKHLKSDNQLIVSISGINSKIQGGRDPQIEWTAQFLIKLFQSKKEEYLKCEEIYG